MHLWLFLFPILDLYVLYWMPWWLFLAFYLHHWLMPLNGLIVLHCKGYQVITSVTWQMRPVLHTPGWDKSGLSVAAHAESVYCECVVHRYSLLSIIPIVGKDYLLQTRIYQLGSSFGHWSLSMVNYLFWMAFAYCFSTVVTKLRLTECCSWLPAFPGFFVFHINVCTSACGHATGTFT